MLKAFLTAVNILACSHFLPWYVFMHILSIVNIYIPLTSLPIIYMSGAGMFKYCEINPVVVVGSITLN